MPGWGVVGQDGGGDGGLCVILVGPLLTLQYMCAKKRPTGPRQFADFYVPIVAVRWEPEAPGLTFLIFSLIRSLTIL